MANPLPLCFFFTHLKGHNNITDLFLYQPPYHNAIPTTCPHILHCYDTSIISNKDVWKHQQVLKDLVKVIQQSLTQVKTQLQNVVNTYVLTSCLGKSWRSVNQFLWMTSWWLVLRISLKMLIFSYMRLFVAPTCVSALTHGQTDRTRLWKKLKSGLSIWLECKTAYKDWF